MTANWAKLNKEFDDLFDSLTDEELLSWYQVKESKKALRREILKVTGKIWEIILQIQELPEFHCNIDAVVHTDVKPLNVHLDFSTVRKIVEESSSPEYTPPMAA